MLRPLLAICLCAASAGCGASDEPSFRRYQVKRGSVRQEAVAVGRIEPRVEVPVSSSWGGVVTQRFVALGDRVKAGAPLLEIRPQLTDQQRLRSGRSLEAALEGLEGAKEIYEGQNLMGKAMRFVQGNSSLERIQAGAERARTDAQLQQRLLLEGRAEHDGLVLDWIIRAPIDGTIIELPVETGQPVVPASTFGAGTPLLILADIDHPVLRATVDELDAGRLAAGMSAHIELGALPAVEVSGSLREISLRASDRDGATVFGVVLDIAPPTGVILRAGYSAVARIVVGSVEDVAVLPERLIDYRGDGAFVQVWGDAEETSWVKIEVGASDGMTAVVLSGLDLGDEVLEQIP